MDTKKTSFHAIHSVLVIALLFMCLTGTNAQDFGFEFYNYTGDQLWSNSGNWQNGLQPIDENAEVLLHADVIVDKDVVVQTLSDATPCSLTIQAGKKLIVKTALSWTEGGNIVLEDKAQLVNDNPIPVNLMKRIKAYNADNHLWNLIASPIMEDVVPSIKNGFLTEPESGYALYTYNTSNHEWISFKESPFTLVNGISYLYANALDTVLLFSGNARGCAAPTEISLTYQVANGALSGCNFVGNPLPCNAFMDRSYYVLNERSNSLIAIAHSSCSSIPPCQGIIVDAIETGDMMVFSHEQPNISSNGGYLEITVAKSNAQHLILDQALLSFNAGDDLSKFTLYEGAPLIYFTKDNKDLAILSIDSVNVQAFKFKAETDGTYTFHFQPKDLNPSYLNLVDNLTGANINLLANPNYTFNATTSDYASRFKLVFDPHYGIEEGGLTTGSEAFAYYADGNIIINDVETCHGASLLVIDMMGRIVWSETINERDGVHTVSTQLIPGVYVLRLATKHAIRTQKMVID